MSVPENTHPTGRLRAYGLVLASASLVLAAPAHPAAPYVPNCSMIAFSPSFATDGVGMCSVVERQVTGSTIQIAVTTDRGRSWRVAAAHGLVWSAPTTTAAVYVSTDYANDRTLLVSTDAGLFASTDVGASFQLVDGAARNGRPGNPALYLGETRPELSGLLKPWRVYAAHGVGPRPARLDVEMRLRQPVPGSPNGALLFAVPPRLSASGSPIAFMSRIVPDDPGASQVVAYRCTADFACGEQLFAFPPHYWTPRVVFGGGVDSKTIFVTMQSDLNSTVAAWRSTDGGASWAPWDSVNRLLAKAQTVRYPAIVRVATRPGASKSVYLRISNDPPAPSSSSDWPTEQVHRSDDGGTSWRLVAFARETTQRGPRGTLPWSATNGSQDDTAGFYVAPDGRLFALGADIDVRGRLTQGVFCSVDGGRSWARLCPR